MSPPCEVVIPTLGLRTGIAKSTQPKKRRQQLQALSGSECLENLTCRIGGSNADDGLIERRPDSR